MSPRLWRHRPARKAARQSAHIRAVNCAIDRQRLSIAGEVIPRRFLGRSLRVPFMSCQPRSRPRRSWLAAGVHRRNRSCRVRIRGPTAASRPVGQPTAPNGVALGELPGAGQVELDSAGDVPDGRFAGPGAGCPGVGAWPLVMVRQAPGTGGGGPGCGRRSARCIQGRDRSG
jgi:hypothetical protein